MPHIVAAVLILSLLFAAVSSAQTLLSEQQAIDLVLRNHPGLQAGAARVQQQQILSEAPAVWTPTELYHNTAADPDLGMFGCLCWSGVDCS